MSDVANAGPDQLKRLSNWYSAQCNGEWEHKFGVHVGTLDNPGWTLRVSLQGTRAEGRALDRVRIERSLNDWLHCWVDQEKQEFHAAMGSINLAEGVEAFLDWFERV